jgi:hypothetical protein
MEAMPKHGDTARCRECNKEFVQWTARQEFCDDRCRGAFHRRRYRELAVEEAEFRRELRKNGDGPGTPEERKEAEEALAKIVRESQVTPGFRRRI